MKRIFSYLFLLVFLVVYLRPYLPYVEYYLNQKYIAEELCENKDKPQMNCHGKCHLKKEIKKVTKEKEEPLFPTNNETKERQITFFYAQNSLESIFTFEDQEKQQFYYTEAQSSPHLIEVFNPPQL